MYFYENEEIATKLVELEIANREYVIALSEIVKSVVKDFDGKVINKRFVTALDEGISKCDGYENYTYVTYDLNSYSFVISVHCPNRSVNVSEYGCSYVNSSTIELCRISPDSAVVYNDKGTARLCADKVIEGIDMGVDALKDYIITNRAAIDKVSEWKTELLDLDKRLSEINNEMPYDLSKYFGLRYGISKR